MSDLKALSLPILTHIAQLLGVSLKSLTATIELLDEGSTVPFIARYRKEATGNLDEVQIRAKPGAKPSSIRYRARANSPTI
jgi:protein Tex